MLRPRSPPLIGGFTGGGGFAVTVIGGAVTVVTLGAGAGVVVVVGGGVANGGGASSSSWARRAPNARVCKAMNQIGAPMMDAPQLPGTPVMFVCGDDAAAKDITIGLVSELGFEAVDAGGLTAVAAAGTVCAVVDSLGAVSRLRHQLGLRAVVRPGVTVIEYIRYRIPPDRGEAVVQAYRNAVVPLERSDYCVDHELSQCAEEPELFMLRIR